MSDLARYFALGLAWLLVGGGLAALIVAWLWAPRRAPVPDDYRCKCDVPRPDRNNQCEHCYGTVD